MLSTLSVQGAAFDITVTPSATQVTVGSDLSYTIVVQNISSIPLGNPVVTASFGTGANFVSATNSNGTWTNSATGVAFSMNPVAFGEFFTNSFLIRPTVAGTLTNTVIAAADGVFPVTNIVTTAVISGVSGSILRMTVSAPATPLIVGDSVTYKLTSTNLGPDRVTGLVLSNFLSAPALFQGVAPGNVQVTSNNNAFLFNIGALEKDAGTNLSVTVETTTAGLLTVSLAGIAPVTISNTPASITLTVVTPNTNQLVATAVPGQSYNPQTGLMEQTVHLQNIGATSTVSSARVVVVGLTNFLYNAVGTNSGNPFVVYGLPLGPGETVDLILEYFVPTRLPIADPNFIAYEVPNPGLAAPTSAPPNITLVTNLAPDRVLIEFESVPGNGYLILYSDNASFTNALTAQPAVAAQANRVQWIDDGPPKTIIRPGFPGATTRFYRVIGTQ